jgi:hypothetical protein
MRKSQVSRDVTPYRKGEEEESKCPEALRPTGRAMRKSQVSRDVTPYRKSDEEESSVPRRYALQEER